MKRLWVILPLILFNFIFSQDILSTTDGKEISGKFISIVDKGVKFQIKDSPAPSIIPSASIVEITDSNGKLILNSTTLSLKAEEKEKREKIANNACIGVGTAGCILILGALSMLGGPGSF